MLFDTISRFRVPLIASIILATSLVTAFRVYHIVRVPGAQSSNSGTVTPVHREKPSHVEFPSGEAPGSGDWIITWREVPLQIGLMPATSTEKPMSRKPLIREHMWVETVKELVRDAWYGASEDEADLCLRAAGYASAVDVCVLKHLGISVKTTLIADHKFYFPACPIEVTVGDLRPEEAQRRLFEIIRNPSIVSDDLPDQFRSPDSPVAIRDRALLFLGSFGNTPQSSQALLQEFEHPSSESSKYAALSAIIATGLDENIRTWLTAQTDTHIIMSIAAAMSADSKAGVIDKRQGAQYFAPFSRNGRQYDTYLVDTASKSKLSSVQKVCVLAMSGRWDNPKVREYICNLLESTDDPSIAAVILRTGIGYSQDPKYNAGILKWLNSSNDQARLWALWSISYSNEPYSLKSIERFIPSDDPRYVATALDAMWFNGSKDPDKALGLLKSIKPRVAADHVVSVIKRRTELHMQDFLAHSEYSRYSIEFATKSGFRPVGE